MGYVLGVRDTREFVEGYRRCYLPWLKGEGKSLMPTAKDEHEAANEPSSGDQEVSIHEVMRSIVHQPELMLNEEFPDLIRQFPAHLHIDILDDWQRKGWGKKLIEALCDELRAEGVKGVHLGMVGTNYGAITFYEKLGFRRFNGVMDGGASGEVGRARDGGLWMVKKLERFEQSGS